MELQRIQDRCPPRGLAVATIAAILEACKLSGNNGILGGTHNNNNNNPLALKPPTSMLMLQASAPNQQTSTKISVQKHTPQASVAARKAVPAITTTDDKQVSRADKGTNTVNGDKVKSNDTQPPTKRATHSESEGSQDRSISELRKCLQNCPVVSSNSATSSAGDLLANQQHNSQNLHCLPWLPTATSSATYEDYEEENINADTRSSDLDFANLQLECMCSSDSVISSPTASTYKCVSGAAVTDGCSRKRYPSTRTPGDEDFGGGGGGSNSNNSMQNTNSAKNNSCSCTLEEEVAAVVSYGGGGQILDNSGNGAVIFESAGCYTPHIGDKSANYAKCQVGAAAALVGNPMMTREGAQGDRSIDGGDIIAMPKAMLLLQKQKSLNATTMGMLRENRPKKCGKTLSCGDVVIGRHSELQATVSTANNNTTEFRELLPQDYCLDDGTDNDNNRSSIDGNCPRIDDHDDDDATDNTNATGNCSRSATKEIMTPTGGCDTLTNSAWNVSEGNKAHGTCEQTANGDTDAVIEKYQHHQPDRQVVLQCSTEELRWKSGYSQQMGEDCKYGEDGGQELCKEMSSVMSQGPQSPEEVGNVESAISKDAMQTRLEDDAYHQRRQITPSVDDGKQEEVNIVCNREDNISRCDERDKNLESGCGVGEVRMDIAIDGSTSSVASAESPGNANSSSKKKSNSSRNSPDTKLVLDLNDKTKYTKEVSV